MTLAVAGLAKFYSFFKTGATPSDLLTEAQQERLIHDPIYTWDLSNVKEGVLLDQYTQEKIKDAYTSAWYILNKSNTEQKDLGIADKFSKKMLNKITKSYESDSEIREERVDLEHHIDLHLFSYDRQLVSFTDHRVKVLRKIIDDPNIENKLIKDTLTFDVVMGLEDGYWKVFEMLQLPEDKEKDRRQRSEDRRASNVKSTKKVPIPKRISGINYYPANNPWLDFWPNYDPQITREDLALCKDLGFNHLRIFLPYSVFGKGQLDMMMVDRLDDFLSVCTELNITTTLSLFDFPESYHLAYYASTRKHLIQLLERYKSHPAVAIWDLKNEADLDFIHYGEQVVMQWLDFMITSSKEVAPEINLTIGWSDLSYAHYFAEELDLYSFHLYKDIEEERVNFQVLKDKKLNKPFYISEFGKTTYLAQLLPFGSTKKEQAIYVHEVMEFMQQESIEHYAFWTLYDFDEAPKEVIGWKPWIRNAQANMGLVDLNRNLKPAFINFENNQNYNEQLSWHEKIKSFYLYAIIFSCTFLLIVGKLFLRKK